MDAAALPRLDSFDRRVRLESLPEKRSAFFRPFAIKAQLVAAKRIEGGVFASPSLGVSKELRFSIWCSRSCERGGASYLPDGEGLFKEEVLSFYLDVKKKLERIESPGSYVQEIGNKSLRKEVEDADYREILRLITIVISILENEYTRLHSFWCTLPEESLELNLIEGALKKISVRKEEFQKGRKLVEGILGVSLSLKPSGAVALRAHSAFTRLTPLQRVSSLSEKVDVLTLEDLEG